MNVRRLWRRSRRDVHSDLEEEFRFHVERRVGELVSRGWDERAARAEALRRFGDMRETLEVCMESDVRRERRLHRREWLGDVAQDVRLGARQLIRRPGFAGLTVLTLGTAIGAAAAIYAVADHVLVRPLPYVAPDRVMTLWEVSQEGERTEVSAGNYIDWKDRSRSFAAMGLAEPWSVDLTNAGAPQVMRAWLVTEGWFEALGVRPVIGRSFAAEDYAARSPVALLSYQSWQERFGGDRAIVGRVLTLDGAGVEIIGVLPPSLEYPAPEELWLPKTFRPEEVNERRAQYMRAVARLAPGVTTEQAQAELDGIARALSDEHIANRGRGVQVVPLTDQVLGEARPVVAALLLATLLLLLIACANVANLIVSRGLERGSELAVRSALGASRPRLVRQLITESVVLSASAGAVGVVLAYWGIRVLTSLAPADLPRISAVTLDGRVLLFVLVLTLLTAALFGSVPALRLSRPDLMSGLRGGSARSAYDGLRRVLVGGEVAFCFMLLIGAGLLTRSLLRLTQNELGFDTQGRASAQTFLWDNNPDPAQRIERVREIIARMEAQPGVQRAAATSSLPFHPHAITSTGGLLIEGEPVEQDDPGRRVLTTVVTPQYFAVMGIELVSGRAFTAADGPATTPVVIINQTLARTYFPGADPIGRRIRGGVMGAPITREIVGIVADVRPSAFDAEPQAELYVPHTQTPTGSVTFVVHGSGRGEALLAGMRSSIWAADPRQTIYHDAAVSSLVSATLAQRTFQLTLTGAFGAMALLLVILGVYGVVTLWARERRRELGVRIALGARSTDILQLIVRQGLGIVLPGLLIGAVAAAFLSRGLERMLYGVRPTDAVTFGYTAALLLLCAAAAAFVPARAALRADPVRSIRSD